MIERTFRDIPKGKIEEADTRDYLVSLGYSRAIGWEDLLKSKRILIVSEAGAGKTFECQSQANHLLKMGEASFFLELAALSQNNLRDLLSSDEEVRLDNWLTSQDAIATFFLDSIDELKLSRGSLKLGLQKLAKGVGGNLNRLRVVITTRPIPFDEKVIRRTLPVPPLAPAGSDEDSFVDAAMGVEVPNQQMGSQDEDFTDWRIVGLMPMSNEQIVSFAKNEGVKNPDKLLADIYKRNAQDFARRPQDLVEICADWKAHKRIRTHKEQVETNVRVKLLPRSDRREITELSQDKAHQGAKRLALAVLLTRIMTIRHSAAAADVSDNAALDPADILPDWTQAERKALLERPLFGFASYGRVRFHHRSVAEFLAAQRLSDLLSEGMTLSSLKRLLFADTKGKTIVRPSMRPVAGWLGCTLPKIFSALRDFEPSVLVNEGDPESLTSEQKRQVLKSYVRLHGAGGWRGLNPARIQVHRFASPSLASSIVKLWRSKIENSEVREMLLELIGAGKMSACRDILLEVAGNVAYTEVERIESLLSLQTIDAPELASICGDIANGEEQWPDSLARRAMTRLFPSHMTVSQLETLFMRLPHNGERSLDEIEFYLPREIERSNFTEIVLEELRDALVRGICSDLVWDEKSYPKLKSSYSHLGKALAATCNLGLKNSKSDEWLFASMLAVRMPDKYGRSDGPAATLRTSLRTLDMVTNARLFGIEDKFLKELRTPKDNWRQLYELVDSHGATSLVAERDSGWIEDRVKDRQRGETERAFYLEAALRYTWSGDYRDYAQSFFQHVEDSKFLTEMIEKKLRPSAYEADERKRQKKREVERVKAERKKAKNRASWMSLRRDILNRPEIAFSEKNAENTVYNLCKIMGRLRKSSETYAWHRPFLEQHFDQETLSKVIQRLGRCWRKIIPTLPSERETSERNTYYLNWSLGLAGLYAESETEGWADRLTSDEAMLACRYCLVKLNGFPAWIDQMAIAHPDAMQSVLVEELGRNFTESWDEQAHPSLLSSAEYASTITGSLFCKSIVDALERYETGNDQLQAFDTTNFLQRACDVVRKHGSETQKLRLNEVAVRSLQKSLSPDDWSLWIRVHFSLDPATAFKYFETKLKSITPAKDSDAIGWFAMLFGTRSDAANLSDPRFDPPTLLELLRLAYLHVRIKDDNAHEGGRLMDTRDDAERARNSILNAILEYPGEEGWKAKVEMSKDPLFEHFRDRIVAIAEEKWANEIDATPYTIEQFVALSRTGDSQPNSNHAMLDLIKDRLSDLDELLLTDTSPREAWALIENEYILRREIARELLHMARDTYIVDQEAVTADEKETDIRLFAKHSPYQGVIELKIADNDWSGRVLVETISNQLVARYLAPENRRAGALVLTLSIDRKWEHPDTGKRINLDALMKLLKAEARRVEKTMRGEVLIAIHCLDLRPRLKSSGDESANKSNDEPSKKVRNDQ